MKNRIKVRLMTEADLAFADAVRAAAGWNQTEQDWRRLLEYQPDGCFVAECDGEPAGTTTTTCYGTELAWIGMVLVYPHFRRRGVGRALMEHCLDFLRRKGIRCVKLDATPLGKLLYDQLGFRDEWTLTRWGLDLPGAPTAGTQSETTISPRPESYLAEKHEDERTPPSTAPALRPASPGDVSALRVWQAGDAEKVDLLDSSMLGVSRLEMLKRLARDSSLALVHESHAGEIRAYGMSRPGSRAWYIGPVVATSPAPVVELIRALYSPNAGKAMFWDIPDGNTQACSLAQQMGFTPQRPLIRMYLGPNPRTGSLTQCYAIADPGIG